MEILSDFLAFRTLISRHALLLFYYLGAVGMPLAAWLSARYLLRRVSIAQDALDTGKRLVASGTCLRHRVLFIAMFMAAFLFMELMWRMMFEYLIAFMQMRDALVLPVNGVG